MKQRVTGTWPRSELGVQLALHVADHVLLEEEAQVAGVQVVDQRRGQRQDVPGQLAHLLGHLQLGHAVADQRFVHVEVEEPNLGVGDPPQRLDVDADELEEGDEREAGGEDPRAVAQRLHVVGVEQALALQRGAEDDEDALDQLRLEPGLAGDLLHRRLLLRLREEVLGEAEGEAALAARPLEVLERVAALAHPRDDAGLGGRGGGPAATAHRHDLLLGPALQRARRDAGAARGLAEGYPFVGGHRGPRLVPAGVMPTGRAPAGPAPRPRRCGCESPPRPAGRRSCRRRPRRCGRA